jgi:hypothetical protein
MEEHPSVAVYCHSCGDEIEVVDVERNADGTLSVTVAGACQRDCQRAVDQAAWEGRQQAQRVQERADRILRENQRAAETERFLREERERKERHDREWQRFLGYRR